MGVAHFLDLQQLDRWRNSGKGPFQGSSGSAYFDRIYTELKLGHVNNSVISHHSFPLALIFLSSLEMIVTHHLQHYY